MVSRRLPWFLLSLMLAGVAAAEPPRSATLPTTIAEYHAIPREYRLDGVVEAIHRTTVSAQTQGQVEAIHYDVDDYVERGAVLVELRDTEHRARVTQAAADLKSATAKLEQTREEYDRIEGLFAKRNVSESQMDRAAADLKAAQAALESATAQLEQAQEQLSYTEIRAPYSGIVTHRHVELGETASPGTPVMTGLSLDELRVVVEVPQSLIPAVRSGTEIHVDLTDGERLAVSDVTVFPFADMGSNTFTVRLRLPVGTRSLFPGMYVKTGFVTGERRELVVPKAAVVYRSELTAVYVQGDDGRLALRQIRAGRTVDDQILVLAGLEAGERVVLDPLAASRQIKAQTAPATEGHGDD
ncbi:efflux RND transporter periplasmic adaptor subunit [Thiococcus pfennigii]|jgi:RND family efflux transporter MFP subunit|uniref:efflux RND transporter periplasmic adaptor subunit n=1 Tax=Thiococcus pfennigii TaxID=1057 RepID=UPI001905F528|nr:efflux RND transporter periplasmic adaptor subunit [Thiococcus pfennigii]MBK1732172.1 efflux transporter periplasmic adaptor subunit [Thiococcus pfennigii]